MSHATPSREEDSSGQDEEDELSFADMVMESLERTDLETLYAENDEL